jgi:c-di-GMP-binding flagellar brake protein YcgR
MEERRKLVRLDASVKVNYRILTAVNLASDSVSHDFSEGGVRIEVKEPIQPKTLLSLDLMLPGEKEPVKVKGEVIWMERYIKQLRPVYEVGIKFIDIDSNEKNKLNQYFLTILKGKTNKNS